MSAASSILNRVQEFVGQYDATCIGCNVRGEPDRTLQKKGFKKNHAAFENLSKIEKQANEAIASWVKTPESFLARIKHSVRNLLHKAPDSTPAAIKSAAWWKKPAMWLGHKVHQLENRITPFPKKTAASEPYEFGNLSNEEKKKARFIKAVATTILVAGAILLIGGITVPIALTPLLVTLPPAIAFAVIAGSTVGGVTGVVGIITYPLLVSQKSVVEYEAEKDPDFQRFVREFVERDAGFNVRRCNIQEGKLLAIYQEWKRALEKQFSKQKLEALKKERDKPRFS